MDELFIARRSIRDAGDGHLVPVPRHLDVFQQGLLLMVRPEPLIDNKFMFRTHFQV